MDNRWAEPDGANTDVKETRPVRYLIRDGGPDGNLVVRETIPTKNFRRHGEDNKPMQAVFHSMAEEDQTYSDATVALVQEACEYFYIPPEGIKVYSTPGPENEDGDTTDTETTKYYTPMEGADLDPPIDDNEVLRRINRLDGGENTREASRARRRRYPLTELPWYLQRNLIERIAELQRLWGFEILGEVDSADFAGRLLVLEADKEAGAVIKFAVARAESDMRQAKTRTERDVREAHREAGALMLLAKQRHEALRAAHDKEQVV